MNTPTFYQQRDKLIIAYMQGKLDLCVNSECGVGTILNNYGRWAFVKSIQVDVVSNAMKEIFEITGGLYTRQDLINLEMCILNIWANGNFTEDSLFQGICAFLDLLKTIHLSSGEIIEEEIVVEKRKLNFV